MSPPDAAESKRARRRSRGRRTLLLLLQFVIVAASALLAASALILPWSAPQGSPLADLRLALPVAAAITALCGLILARSLIAMLLTLAGGVIALTISGAVGLSGLPGLPGTGVLAGLFAALLITIAAIAALPLWFASRAARQSESSARSDSSDPDHEPQEELPHHQKTLQADPVDEDVMTPKPTPPNNLPEIGKPIVVQFMTEKIAGDGEDAQPVAIVHAQDPFSLIAVFDGLGGAGSTEYSDQGKIRSGAYFASRHAAEVLRWHFTARRAHWGKSTFDVDALVDDLKLTLGHNLKARLEKLRPSSPLGGSAIVRSNMSRPLPTTMAALYFREIVAQADRPATLPEADAELTPTSPIVATEDATPDALIAALDSSDPIPALPPVAVEDGQGTGDYEIVSVWAGDSRCYLLTPDRGLMQLTRDDLRKSQDAFDNIYDDGPMSNYLSADGNFTLRAHVVQRRPPLMLITATDGCFGYLEAPYMFEYFILQHLMDAENAHDWQDRLQAYFGRVAQDDASMAIVALGASSFDDLKKRFRPRYLITEGSYFKPLERYQHEIEDADKRLKTLSAERKALRLNLWKQYKEFYEDSLYRPETDPTEPFTPVDE